MPSGACEEGVENSRVMEFLSCHNRLLSHTIRHSTPNTEDEAIAGVLDCACMHLADDRTGCELLNDNE